MDIVYFFPELMVQLTIKTDKSAEKQNYKIEELCSLNMDSGEEIGDFQQ